MKKEIQVPEIGESVASGILASWLKHDGDQVDEGEEIFELETDKATLAVPSPAGGALSSKKSSRRNASLWRAPIPAIQLLF